MGNSTEKNRNVVFKTSIGGYKKKIVNEYIENENRRFAELEAEYNETIEGLRRDLDAAHDKIGTLRVKADAYSSLQVELEEKNALLSEKEAALTSLENALSQKNDELRDANEKAVSLVAQLADTKAEITRLSDELETKQESLSSRNTAEYLYETDAILNRARNATEDMLRRAEAGAEVILDRARKEALDYREEIFAAAKEVFTAATEELRRSIGICMSDFVSGIKSAKNDPARATDTSARCDDDLARRIERMQNDLDRAIAEKLAEFDARR